MFIAKQSPQDHKVYSFCTDKRNTYYRCQHCDEPLYLQLDHALKLKRFYHYPNQTKQCPLKHRESTSFYHCQYMLFQALKKANIPVYMDERILSSLKVYAPLMVNINNIWTAIEIERPTLTPKFIIERSQFYQQQNIPVLWLLLNGHCDSRTLYTLKSYESEIARLQNGLVFFWGGGLNLSLCRVYPQYYYPTKKDQQQHSPKKYKFIVRLLFAADPVSLTTLTPQLINVDNQDYYFAVSPVQYHWPVLEKPRLF